MRRIVVLGATGRTGRQVAEELSGRDRVLLVGRDPSALAEVGAATGLPVAVGELDGLAAILAPGDVLLSTVGPFDLLGDVVAGTAISSAVTYVDISTEPGFLDRMHDAHGPQAALYGVTLLPSVGLRSMVGHLVADAALRDAGDRAAAITITYLDQLGPDPIGIGPLKVADPRALLRLRSGSEAGRRSQARLLSGPTWSVRRGRLQREPVGARMRGVLDGAPTTSVGGAEVWTLLHHRPDLQAVDVHSGDFGALAPAVTLSTRLGRPFRLLQGDKVVDAALQILGDGERTPLGRSRVVATVRDASGAVVAQRDAIGPDGARLTARLAAATVERLADRDLRSLPVGCTDPLAVFGSEGLAEVCGWAGVVLASG